MPREGFAPTPEFPEVEEALAFMPPPRAARDRDTGADTAGVEPLVSLTKTSAAAIRSDRPKTASVVSAAPQGRLAGLSPSAAAML